MERRTKRLSKSTDARRIAGLVQRWAKLAVPITRCGQHRGQMGNRLGEEDVGGLGMSR